jgi:hypothetical protein
VIASVTPGILRTKDMWSVGVMLVTGIGDKIVDRLGRARGRRGRRPHAEGPNVADAMIDAKFAVAKLASSWGLGVLKPYLTFP